MIVRFTIIDQRLLLHLTASSPDPHPTRPPLRHIILAVVCRRLLGITAVGMESGKPGGYLQGDKCGEGKPKARTCCNSLLCVLVSWARAALDQQYMIYDLLRDSGYFFFFLVGRLRASCHALDMYECR